MRTKYLRGGLLPTFVTALLIVSAISLLNVSPVSADTSTQGGTQTGVQVRIVKIIHQNKYEDNANDLHFKLWQKEDWIHVNGWKVDISHFTSSSSQRGSQPPPWNAVDDNTHAVDVTASGTNIPYCTSVTVKASFWLTQWNTLRIDNIRWTYENDENYKKAMPSHGWDIDWEQYSGGVYRHPLGIYNDDNTDNLVIENLYTVSTMFWYENLDNVPFGPTPDNDNITLSSGENWSKYIDSDNSLIGGHIYFKYTVVDENGDNTAKFIFDHPVTDEPRIGGIVTTVNKLALLAPWIALAAIIPIAIVSVVVYWRRR